MEPFCKYVLPWINHPGAVSMCILPHAIQCMLNDSNCSSIMHESSMGAVKSNVN